MRNHVQPCEYSRSKRGAGYGPQIPAAMPSFLHLVSPREVQKLREALVRNWVPVDLEVKLACLAWDNLTHRFIEENSRLFISILQAGAEGSFGGTTAEDQERLLRVLAYVHKDDDAIHDHKPGGYADDLQEVRAARIELHQLLTDFKLWRLQHQGPNLWPAPGKIQTEVGQGYPPASRRSLPE